MTNTDKSILIVSPDPVFTRSIQDVMPADGTTTLSTEESTFAALNGKGNKVAFENDMVIFYADPDDKAEIMAIADLLKERQDNTAFVAITDSEITISKAQTLRDVGVDDVLPSSISQNELHNAIQASLKSHAPVPVAGHNGAANQNGSVIAVSQARGGAGATTVAVNLAHTLLGAQGMFKKTTKQRVALVDLDLQFGNANVFLDLEDNGGMFEIIESLGDPDAAFMQGAMVSHPSGLDVLVAPSTVAPFNSLTPEKVSAMLDVLRLEYDYVVIDMPRALVDWVGPVLKRVSNMLIVSDTSVPSVRQARRLIDFFREDHVGLPVNVVINREDRPMMKSAHHKEAEKVLDTKIQHWLPDNPKAARKAVDLGQPVVSHSASANLSRALKKLATDLQTTQFTQQSKQA